MNYREQIAFREKQKAAELGIDKLFNALADCIAPLITDGTLTAERGGELMVAILAAIANAAEAKP